MRNELRRTRALDEVALGALDEEGTAALLEATLGDTPSRPLVRAIHDRAQGLPFFVEELASALAGEGRLQKGHTGMELAEEATCRFPRPFATRFSCAALTCLRPRVKRPKSPP